MSSDSTSPEITASLMRRQAATRELWLPVSGPSMTPTITGGSVLVQPASAIRRGEIWAYASSGPVIVHRVLRSKDGWVWLKGDGNRVTDLPVPAARMIGHVVATKNEVGQRRAIARRHDVLSRFQLDAKAVARRAGGYWAKRLKFVKNVFRR